MKKLFLIALIAAVSAASSFAEWALIHSAGGFLYEDGSSLDKEFNYAFIVDMNNGGFGSFRLQTGDVFRVGEFLNSSNNYKTILSNTLVLDDGLAFAMGSDAIDNDKLGITAGAEIAIVVWNSNNDTAFEGDKYCIFTPSMTSTGELSKGDQWIVYAGSSGEDELFYLQNNFAGGKVPDSFTMLSKTVGAVPEAGYCAALFGLAALAFAFRRRRK